ncbi:restriction endonuclease subunit S [Mycoplasma bovis]|uniref:restriction endonuclease subunit S n=2 Tax=Mycoplasmopsis bovis TaxID=28903 RepID=UPI000E107713|nr:restriction endonuclease subunit S [Mycoplasmopsis bovis]AXJ77638.1 type I restriction endonuclease subunit S [Mycoplasmopsis bovis]MBT1381817.1 restriction endonuclease subunit S [Mycoplasmopsis bovis]
MSNKLLVPRIRFKEFTNAWEQEKLGECSKFYNGLTSVSKSDFGVGKDLYIDYLNVFNNTFSQFSELKKFKNSSRQNYVQFKDVILTISSETPDEVAMSSVINWKNDYKNVAFNSFCILVRFNQLEKYDVNYIGYFFRSNSFRTQAMLMAQGISRFNINQTALKKTLFLFPPNIYEQQKIGNVLYYLDSLITLHQRKLLSLKNLKSRLLDRMFCDEKSQFPSIRFKEFTNAWEQGKLGNLIDKGGSGGTPNTSNAKFYNGSIPFLTIADLTKADGHIYSTEKHITNEGLNSSSAWIVPKGSLTLSIYATIGKIGIMHQNMATSQAFYSMVINDDITKKYLYYHLKKSDVFGEWTKLISTGTQANLNSEKVKSFGIFIPKNKSEQSKISSLFTHLDSLITLHQRKLNSLKNIKNTLLDKMFV